MLPEVLKVVVNADGPNFRSDW